MVYPSIDKSDLSMNVQSNNSHKLYTAIYRVVYADSVSVVIHEFMYEVKRKAKADD